ncbi:sensor histidine kinase [Rhodovibrio salinarum]|uniref:histidine kinase n=1 Tax=Rhodovibrio salinarum TaxID=1087 RepID=A0A934QGD3_9PROT|nr:ATP-binding protein [Rhodovibrio salinarum]MBK1696294.1 hypothetical protein [Rhodovibrio salinarum]
MLTPSASSVRPGRALFLLGLGAIVGLVAFLTYASTEAYFAARKEIVAQTTDEARVLREHADRTFQAVDMALKEVIRTVDTQPWEEIARSRNVWHRMREIANSLPQLRSIWLVDQNGYMRLYSAKWETPPLDTIDREYFSAHGFGRKSHLHFSPTMPGKYTGNTFVPVSRPITVGTYGFRGVVAAAVEPAYYLPILRTDSACADCKVGIYRSDGTAMVTGGRGTATDPTRIQNLFKETPKPGVSAWTSQQKTFLDDHDALATVAMSPTYDIGIVAAAPTSAVWDRWWNYVRGMLIAGVPCVLGLTLLLHRAQLASRIQDHARRDAEAARQREQTLREQAAEANRSKSEFLTLMSHELRTPLNAVIGFSEIISKQSFGPNHPNYREYAQDIYESGQHLLSLINDILDLAKIEAQRHKLYEEEIELAETLRSVRRLAAFRAEQTQVALFVPDSDLHLRADARALKQMLLNLVVNALKFTDPGGSVTVSVARDDTWLYLSVTDTGHGMGPADLERAMQLFGQAENALTRRAEGTGLGINITSALAKLHDGGLDIFSVPGEGTRATVRLPVTRISSNQSSAMAQDSAGINIDAQRTTREDMRAR